MKYAITYSRAKHAGHYAGGGGHDLESWDVVSPTRFHRDGVPNDAEYHSGYLKDGIQYWRFVRCAPLSEGTCAMCEVSQ
jgi:hypothetical protein